MSMSIKTIVTLVMLITANTLFSQADPEAEIRRLKRLAREIKQLRMRLDFGLPVGIQQGKLNQLLKKTLSSNEQLTNYLNREGLKPDISLGETADFLLNQHKLELDRLSEVKSRFAKLIDHGLVQDSSFPVAKKSDHLPKPHALPKPPGGTGETVTSKTTEQFKKKLRWRQISGLDIDRLALAEFYFKKGKELASGRMDKKLLSGNQITPQNCFKKARDIYDAIFQKNGFGPLLYLNRARALAEQGFLMVDALGIDDKVGNQLIQQARSELEKKFIRLPDRFRFFQGRQTGSNTQMEEVFNLYKSFSNTFIKRLKLRQQINGFPAEAGDKG